MKITYNKNEDKEMKALIGFNLCIMEKRMDSLLVVTELSILTTSCFQNHM